jgi:hypothetical protein
MRTTLDFPGELFVHLKTRAAIDGVTLRETVIGLLEKGLAAEASPVQVAAEPRKFYPPPTVPVGYKLDIPAETLVSSKLWDLVWADDDAKAAKLARP